jgi:hypothetical protein
MVAITRVLLLFVFASTLLFYGCGDSGGPKVGTMVGKISYKGAPLTNGIVQVYGSDGRGGSGPIAADGTYIVADAPLGDIAITVKVLSSSMPGMRKAQRPPGTPAMPGESDSPSVSIPSIYGDKLKSGLKFNIKSGSQTNNIELK